MGVLITRGGISGGRLPVFRLVAFMVEGNPFQRGALHFIKKWMMEFFVIVKSLHEIFFRIYEYNGAAGHGVAVEAGKVGEGFLLPARVSLDENGRVGSKC